VCLCVSMLGEGGNGVCVCVCVIWGRGRVHEVGEGEMVCGLGEGKIVCGGMCLRR